MIYRPAYCLQDYSWSLHRIPGGQTLV